jgi:hypothetical protein
MICLSAFTGITGKAISRWAEGAFSEDRIVHPPQIKVTTPRQSVLTEAESLVHGDRNADYGHPLDDFKRTAKIWGAILGIEITPAQVGLCMCGVKIIRECNKSKRDNMVDLAGYAETVAWCHDEQYERDIRTETFEPTEEI